MPKKKKGHWLTKTGQHIPYPEIEDDHLLNILGFLQKRSPYLKASAETEFILWPSPRGDMACDAVDDAQRQLHAMSHMDWLRECHDDYPHLLKIAEEKRLGIPRNWPSEEEADRQLRIQTAREAVPVLSALLKAGQRGDV